MWHEIGLGFIIISFITTAVSIIFAISVIDVIIFFLNDVIIIILENINVSNTNVVIAVDTIILILP